MNTLKKISLLSVFLMVHTIAGASPADSSFADTISMEQIIAYMDSVQGTLDFKTGTITIGDDLATIQVPIASGFYLLRMHNGCCPTFGITRKMNLYLECLYAQTLTWSVMPAGELFILLMKTGM
jgi:hypothetical protein